MRGFILFLPVYLGWVLSAAVKEKSKLKKGDSAFDEIQVFNEAVDLEHNHPPGMHIQEGDIMIIDKDEDTVNDDGNQITKIPLKNNYHLPSDPSFSANQKADIGNASIQEKPSKRGGVRNELRLWRTRTIPYVIDSSREDVTIEIENGLREISSKTCIRFVKRSNEDSYLSFTRGVGCWSTIGKRGGAQPISIGYSCERKEAIVHEVLHALGFFHEQSRYDRDDFINIYWAAIQPDKRDQFKIATKQEMNDLELPYDLKSVMHYGKTAFSVNGGVTVESKKFPDLELGNQEGLSTGDVDEIKRLYRCDELPYGGFGPWVENPMFDEIQLKYRVCFGQTQKVCEGPGVNDGLQMMMVTPNVLTKENINAYMEGCYYHKGRYKLKLQITPSLYACMNSNLFTPSGRAAASRKAFKTCVNFAKKNNFKKFGLARSCVCYYGDDDVDVKQNGKSKFCREGTGQEGSIFLHEIDDSEEKKK